MTDVNGAPEEEPEYTEVDEARKAHRRLFTLGLLALILAIIAFFFPRCDFDDDEFGAGSGLTDQQLIDLIKENCVIPGVTGPAGEDGEPGADGGSGATGESGQDGQDGQDGQSGAQGPAGATGAPGAAGPAGQTGATGAQGEQGICGPIGATGPAGPQGEAGPAGAQGLPGPIGPQGIQGVPGPVGPQGSRGATGPEGPMGPAGPAGTGGLGAYGSFWDQCTQFSLNGDAIPMLFSHSAETYGVAVDSADGGSCSQTADQDDGGPFGSPGGSEIRFSGPGIFNVQFSAQYENLQGGNVGFIEVWIRKNGSNIAWSNTHFFTVANSVREVAVVNWFVPVTCSAPGVCDYYEIIWKPVKDKPEEIALIADPTRSPAIPSIILTVNQVGNLPPA